MPTSVVFFTLVERGIKQDFAIIGQPEILIHLTDDICSVNIVNHRLTRKLNAPKIRKILFETINDILSNKYVSENYIDLDNVVFNMFIYCDDDADYYFEQQWSISYNRLMNWINKI